VLVSEHHDLDAVTQVNLAQDCARMGLRDREPWRTQD
jgi:hypothetical protein